MNNYLKYSCKMIYNLFLKLIVRNLFQMILGIYNKLLSDNLQNNS